MHFENVILETASLTRTKLFYNKTLELPIVKESDEAISFQAGASVLTFKKTTQGKPFYHIAFNITNNKFSESFEWINSKLDLLPMDNGLPIAAYPDWNAQSFYFYDNNGSIIEFIVRFDLPYYSAESFTLSDIKEISEVGIVAENVSETAATMNTEYGIPMFAKSRPSEKFTAMGDDHGLLIIIPKGHGWVPVHKSAHIFPLAIIADGETISF